MQNLFQQLYVRLQVIPGFWDNMLGLAAMLW
jgi:hypothetical protein